MTGMDIFILVVIILGLIFFGLYSLNKWAYKKMDQQQTTIEKTKQHATVYVIDKKRDKITNVNFPKAVIEQVPKYYRAVKMNFVQVKIGPQIVTMMCDKNVYNAIPTKKNVKVEIAGMYIVSVQGMKSAEEMKKIAKEKKAREKAEKKALKAAKKTNK